ncbi:hypothetical protein [Gilvimarinus polysaccharolyticus]|uniref:hypothetical protein n=1 Tax=Gilvimarinus polysaccharolyticus TaxID=863921 RepID=UPI00067311B9|nr:hypothetical protein [Gilvimarinus polysaccharolyticus]
MTITVAFKETETGMCPCHPSNIQRDDIYYLVVGGVKGPLLKATASAQASSGAYRETWEIPSIEAV